MKRIRSDVVARYFAAGASIDDIAWQLAGPDPVARSHRACRLRHDVEAALRRHLNRPRRVRR